MKFQPRLKLRVIGSAVILLAAAFILAGPSSSGPGQARNAEDAIIKITLIPPKGEGPDSNGTIGGKASSPTLKDCRVVIFARTDRWYVQPTKASPYTSIGQDGEWQTDIHLGYDYAALLVSPSYKVPDTGTMETLPKVAGAVLAIDRVPGKKE